MDMICVEGYKAFRGTMKIVPLNKDIPPYTMTGDWLYIPSSDCWYSNGHSFPACVCHPEDTE